MDDSLIESSGIAKGEYVVYGTNGICLVEDIKMMRFALDAEKDPYCILKPASNGSSTIYVPLNNEKLMGKLRPIMTKEEIDSLLLGMRDKEISWDSGQEEQNREVPRYTDKRSDAETAPDDTVHIYEETRTHHSGQKTFPLRMRIRSNPRKSWWKRNFHTPWGYRPMM